MGIDARSFAYPEGAVNGVAETLPRSCGYESARSAGGVSPSGPLFAEHVPPTDPFATAALDAPVAADTPAAADEPGRPLRAEDLRRAVSAAAAHVGEQERDGWVQVILHRVCSPIDPRYGNCMTGQDPIDSRTLRSFLDWLKYGAPPGTVVMTVRQVMEGAGRARRVVPSPFR
jgi:hypothetical protein